MSDAIERPTVDPGIPPAAVLFDWDDTLSSWREFETTVAVPVITAVLVGRGHDPDDVGARCARYLHFGGGTATGSQREALAFGGYSQEDRDFIHSVLKQPVKASPIPGTSDVVWTLRHLQIPCGVASNSVRDRLIESIDESPVAGAFGTVVSGSDVMRRKPDPSSIILALDNLGIAPEQRASVVYVGNRLHDVAAARAAGVRPWLVGFGIALEETDPQVQSWVAAGEIEYFDSPAALLGRVRTFAGPAARPQPERAGL